MSSIFDLASARLEPASPGTFSSKTGAMSADGYAIWTERLRPPQRHGHTASLHARPTPEATLQGEMSPPP